MNKIYLFLALYLLTISPAFALEGAWVMRDHVKAKLISGVAEIGTQTRFDAALQIRLSDGWHTYWKHPGDAGLPPRFDWSESRNIKNVAVLFPAPKRHKELDFYTFGYSDEVAFPLTVTLNEPGKMANLNLKLDIMICKEVCIPETLEVALSIPSGTHTLSPQQNLIDLAKQKLPANANTGRLKIDTVVAGPDGLSLGVYGASGVQGLDVIAVLEGQVFSSPPQITADKDDGRHGFILTPWPDDIDDPQQFITGKEVVFILTDGVNAIERVVKF